MLKAIFLSIVFLLSISLANAQKRGVNNDPYSMGKGKRPYEMKGRKEPRKPLVTFEDCSRWIIETKKAQVDLLRSEEQPLYRDYNGKLIFTPSAKKCEVTLKYVKPLTSP